MIQSKNFTKIYRAYDGRGFLLLLLYNEINKTAILFDGLRFYYRSEMTSIPKKFNELDYSAKSKKKTFEVEAIRQTDFVTFIKFRNGDIFQLYFMADDNKSNQLLNIFREEEDSGIMTPLGISVYAAAIKRCDEVEDCEINIEENPPL